VTLWAESEVEQIIIEGKRALGVIGERHAAHSGATKVPTKFRVLGNIEIIISAGAISSPQLLMLRYVAVDSLRTR
jgi:choline dehydrogenase-like flavoprotein